jgi:hypothetical protein
MAWAWWQASRTRRWVAIGVVAVVVVGVAVMVARRPRGEQASDFSISASVGDPSPEPSSPRTGVEPPFRAGGALLGDTALLERAARAWVDKAAQDSSFPEPARNRNWRAGEPRWYFDVLWAGPRKHGTRVLLYSGRNLVRYEEPTSGRPGKIDDDTEVLRHRLSGIWYELPIRVDDDGWLLTDTLRDRSFRLLRSDGVREVTAKDGVLDVTDQAVLVLKTDRPDAAWVLGRQTAFRADVREDTLRAALVNDADGPPVAAALMAATERRADYISSRNQIYLDHGRAELMWRGDVPRVGRSAAVVLDGGTWPTVAIGYPDGGKLLGSDWRRTLPGFIGSSDGRILAPLLAGGWVGAIGSTAFVVVGAPEVVRLHVRIGAIERTASGPVAAFSPAELQVPIRPDGKLGQPPSAVVYGETADGTVVPSVTLVY